MTVKSAQRVLEVLEFFAERRQSASVADVCRQLGYPQSSTSMLLASLERLGYVTYDRVARKFQPTIRVMLLGSWLQDELFGEGSLVSAMDRLRRATGQTVMVGIRQGIHVRLVLALRGTRQDALNVHSGQLQSVCLSSIGKMLLASEPDADLARIVRTANAHETVRARRVHVQSLVDEVRASGARGWASSSEYPKPGHAGVGALLPAAPGQPALGIGLGTRSAYMHRERVALVAALQHACENLRKMTAGGGKAG